MKVTGFASRQLRMSFLRLTLGPLACVLLCGLSTASLAQAANTTEGVFSKAQAQRGKTAYTRNCQGCHSNNLQGEGIEPPLIDELFIDAWREDRLFSLYDYMAVRMPKEGRNSTPGSLKPQQYVDILAFILERNGYPSGTSELTLEQLADIQFVGLNGPAPLPQSAMVRAVGCLNANGDAFALSKATPLTRVRVVDETDEHELAQSQAATLSTEDYALTNVRQANEAADSLQGHKVQAKGVLNLIGDKPSLHVLSLVAVAESGC